ncbi:MAG: hypothetical protein IPM42_09630 [Saprospiraceae bacterium]|nr:hypothetical protein [Saprospiraceae bacterium]
MRKIPLQLIFLFITFCGCVYDPPRKTIAIINYSTSETIYVYPARCLNNIDSFKNVAKNYFDQGFGKTIKNIYYINPLDTGYIVMDSFHILNCSDKEVKLFIFKESILKRYHEYEIIKNELFDTIFSINKTTLEDGFFIYRSCDLKISK